MKKEILAVSSLSFDQTVSCPSMRSTAFPKFGILNVPQDS